MTVYGCPHGDPTCPCQDGTAASCHYEETYNARWDLVAWPDDCPNLPPVGTNDEHCHVEGCQWSIEGCGLVRMGVPGSGVIDPPHDSLWWWCGAMRGLGAMWAATDPLKRVDP